MTLKSVSYVPHEDGKISFLRKFSTEQGYIGLSVRTVRESGDTIDGAYEPFVGLDIVAVEPNSPAMRAGLVRGDRVLYADDELLGNPARFYHVVQYHDLQAPMRLRVGRAGQVVEVEVKIGSRPIEVSDIEQSSVQVIVDQQHSGGVFGDLRGPARRYFFDSDEAYGVMLMGINPGSPFFYSQFRKGDVITAVEGYSVTDLPDFAARLAEAGENRKGVQLSVRRGGRSLTSEVKPVRNLTHSVSFHVPLVIGWKKSSSTTSFEIVEGLVFDYSRSAYYGSSGEPRTFRAWSLPLNLVEYKRQGTRRSFKLLWFIGFRW